MNTICCGPYGDNRITSMAVFISRRGFRLLSLSRCVVVLFVLLSFFQMLRAGSAIGYDPYLTFTGNFDLGTRETQFFEADHNVRVVQWDTRMEVWLPPYRTSFSWGPYLRIAGIQASKDPAWENVSLANPGVGFQMYPFSFQKLGKKNSFAVNFFGPLRLFAERNWQSYRGTGNNWRPNRQNRFGAEYWKAVYSNDSDSVWWGEFWTGYWRQSSNEWDAHYNTWIFAYSLRAGLRVPKSDFLSCFTPYFALESSMTDNKTYYWGNRLLTGGGIRFAPSLKSQSEEWKWLNRFVLYAEYVGVSGYYHMNAPSGIPRHDVRIGVNVSVGDWYH